MIGRFFMGALVLAALLGSPLTIAETSQCGMTDGLQWATLRQVVDGDTLRLTDGRKVRLIAVNTPELASDHRSDQFLAQEARAATREFFEGDNRVGLKLGVDAHDRYGRLLAHIYRADGKSLSTYLLSRGLAMQVVVPANDWNWRCYQQVEQLAQKQGIGLWQQTPLDASHITRSDAGFQWLEGEISAVQRGGNNWWLTIGKVAIRLRDSDLKYFTDKKIDKWLGRRVRIRGWVIDRGQSKSVREQSFLPLMMNLQHPAMLN
jgi:endonuclease YncB( thermonuclease family)